ncbi:hypothetical protein NVV43_28730, partial [Escherichia marmotae]|nr:hypothetical protein [Escherichia marmotae]
IRVDPTKDRQSALQEINRKKRPGQPPTRQAAETQKKNLFITEDRNDLSAVALMKNNPNLLTEEIQGTGILSKDYIIHDMKNL